jgi:hypothetical protein
LLPFLQTSIQVIAVSAQRTYLPDPLATVLCTAVQLYSEIRAWFLWLEQRGAACGYPNIAELPTSWISLDVALDIGPLIGMQRELSHHATAGGIRMVPLVPAVGLLSALLAESCGGWIVAAGFVAVAAASPAFGPYHRSRHARNPLLALTKANRGQGEIPGQPVPKAIGFPVLLPWWRSWTVLIHPRPGVGATGHRELIFGWHCRDLGSLDNTNPRSATVAL